MSYPQEWHGSEDPTDEGGVAQFMVEGKNYIISLDSFADMQKVSHMLDAAFESGQSFGARAVKDATVRAAAETYIRFRHGE